MKRSKRICRRAINTKLSLIAFVLLSSTLSAQSASDQSSALLPANPALLPANPAQTNNDRLHGLIGQRQLSNVPDDIGYQLSESKETIDALLPYGLTAPLHRLWDRSNRHLTESLSLDLGLNYTAVYQKADTSISGPRDAVAGDVDFFGSWHLTGDDGNWPGSLVFSSESRHRMTKISPNRLDTGATGGTIVGFGVQDFSMVQLYWEQGSFDDGLILRAGKMDPALIFDGGRYVSSNYAFLSPAFSDTAPMALPGAGIGIAGAIYPTDSTYIAAGLHDANGKRSTTGLNTFFDDAEYFSAIEIGWFPNEGEIDEGIYHLTFWNIDPRKRAGRPTDSGIAMTMEQQVGRDGKFVPFVRYAYANRGLNNIRQNLSAGVGLEGPFGENYDLIGSAFSWQQPSDRARRDQYTFEAFYRFFLTPDTHLTPDVQIVMDPAGASDKNAVTLFGLRIRTLY